MASVTKSRIEINPKFDLQMPEKLYDPRL